MNGIRPINPDAPLRPRNGVLEIVKAQAVFLGDAANHLLIHAPLLIAAIQRSGRILGRVHQAQLDTALTAGAGDFLQRTAVYSKSYSTARARRAGTYPEDEDPEIIEEVQKVAVHLVVTILPSRDAVELLAKLRFQQVPKAKRLQDAGLGGCSIAAPSRIVAALGISLLVATERVLKIYGVGSLGTSNRLNLAAEGCVGE